MSLNPKIMGKIILVRHGETNKNIGRVLHHSKDTESLSSSGIEQINFAAEKLKSYSPDSIFSSKEQRAKDSSAIISKVLGLSFTTMDGLQERNWGIYSGKSWDEVAQVLDKMNLDKRYNYSPPDGESWKIFETRLIKAITTITTINPDKTTILVTHGGAIRALMPFLLNLPKEESFKYDPSNASLTIFNYKNNIFTPETINDCSHLSQT